MKKCCDVCGSSKNLHLGCFTLFDELDYICNDCLSKMSACEFGASYEEIAKNELNMLNLTNEQIYGFNVDGNSVIVEWFDNGNHVKTILVECDSNDEAIDVLCAIS